MQLDDTEIDKLLKYSSCQGEYFSNLFLVPKKTGDMRPVINLKSLNSFIQDIHFKMENIQMALAFNAQGDYMVTIVLKDAYFSVPIFAQHRKYLRLIW